jgi:hypothetical protein
MLTFIGLPTAAPDNDAHARLSSSPPKEALKPGNCRPGRDMLGTDVSWVSATIQRACAANKRLACAGRAWVRCTHLGFKL